MWVVSFLLKRPFGPRIAPECARNHTRNPAQAFFEEAVPGSQIESKRIRKCLVYYYLEDDCLQVFEPAEENSGLPQGCLVRRHRVPRPDGSYYSMADLRIGAILDVYRKMIHIYDCDDFTRRTLTERGLPVSNRLPSVAAWESTSTRLM